MASLCVDVACIVRFADHALTLLLEKAWHSAPMGNMSHAAQRSKRRKKKSNVNVVAPQVQQAYGLEPQTAQGQLETSYLLFLGLVFVLIILEGLFIATSVSDHPTHAQGILNTLEIRLGEMVLCCIGHICSLLCRVFCQKQQTSLLRMWCTLPSLPLWDSSSCCQQRMVSGRCAPPVIPFLGISATHHVTGKQPTGERTKVYGCRVQSRQ